MKPKSFLICSVLLFAFGCGKGVPSSESVKHQTPAPDVVSVPPPVSAASRPAISSTAQPPTAYARPESPRVTPQPVTVPADSVAALGVLTQAVRRFSAENRRVPKSLNEVISAGYVTSLPRAPAGKKYVLNTKRLEVILEND